LAKREPKVVFPLPETPVTIIIIVEFSKINYFHHD